MVAILTAQSKCTPTYPTPRLIGTIHVMTGSDLIVQGQTAFLLGGMLRSIDVSDPTHPQEIGSIDPIGITPAKMTIRGNYIYVVSQKARGGPYIAALEIFDVSDPHSLKPVSTLILDNAIAVSVGIKNNAVYMYDNLNRNIWVIDVSDPANPQYVRSGSPLFIVHEIYIHGNLALLANAGVGLSVLDITTPLNPIFLSTLSVGQSGQGVPDVTAKGQYAYVPSWAPNTERYNKFFVIDISNPSQMEIIASLDIGKPQGSAWNIALEGTLTTVVIQEDPSGYVVLVDISDPTSPQERGRADIPGDLGNAQGGVVIQNGLIYVSAASGLAIYEIVYR
jgi:hypothetical protein